MNRAEPTGQTPPPAGASALVREVFTLPRFALLLAVLLLAWFPDVLLGARSFFTRDFSTFGYPLACQVKRSYLAGEVPLWNPYNFCGLPFLAQWNTMALYPLSAIYVLLPMPWSLNFFNLLHLYLGGLGMFCLASAWIKDDRAAALSGIGYAFGGMMTSALMWPNNIAALGLFPWVWLMGERGANRGGRAWIGFVLLLGLQFLTGAPEITALTWAGLTVLVLFGQQNSTAPLLQQGLRLVSGFGCALILCAAQLLPFLELLHLSQRQGGFATGEWSLDWTGLGNLIVPLFHTIQDRDGIFFQPGQQWVTSPYAGATILVLAVAGIAVERSRRVKWLVAGAVISLTLALGPNAGVYDLLRRIVPGLAIMRYPIKFIVPMTVILPLLAGFGVKVMLSGNFTRRAFARLVVIVSLLALGLVLVSRQWPLPYENSAATARSGLASLILVATLAAAFTWRKWDGMPDGRRLQILAVAMVVFLDLFLANRRINPVVPAKLMEINYAYIEPRPALGQSRLMVSPQAHRRLDGTVFTTPEAATQIPRYAQVLDLNLPDGYPKLDGFFSLYLPASVAVTRRLELSTNGIRSGLLDFLGVSHTNRATNPSAWDRRTGGLPMATLVSRAVYLERAAALDHLFSVEFNPREHVVLPADLAGKNQVEGKGTGRILSTNYAAHHIQAEVECSQPMLLVLSQTDAPGWEARVDGAVVSILNANSAFQAVEVPGGRHSIEFFYRPYSFRNGVIFSIITLTMLLLAALFPDSRRAVAEVPVTG